MRRTAKLEPTVGTEARHVTGFAEQLGVGDVGGRHGRGSSASRESTRSVAVDE